MQRIVAYHGSEQIKAAILAQLAAHRAADEMVKGMYWENGKGCAVGCTIHSADHAEYELRFGIPQMLARLEDLIFEGLPNGQAKNWPEKFMGAIDPGVDLSLVGWRFLHWVLTDEVVNPGIRHPLVADAVRQCAAVLIPLTKGAADSAASAARSAARSAAESTGSAAWSAAESAAWSAAWSAESAARSAAESTARSAESAAYIKMADKLVELISAAGASG